MIAPLLTSGLLALPIPVAVDEPGQVGPQRPEPAIPVGHFRVRSFEFGRTTNMALIEMATEAPAGTAIVLERFGGATIYSPVDAREGQPTKALRLVAVIDRFGVFHIGQGRSMLPGERCSYTTSHRTDGAWAGGSGTRMIDDFPRDRPLGESVEAFLEAGDYKIGESLDAFRVLEMTCTIRVIPVDQIPRAPRRAPQGDGPDPFGFADPAVNP